jgi:tetratricopeptide (TPR) repeat protein
MRRAIDLDPGFARAYAELAFLIDRQGAEIGFDGDRAAFLAEQERLAKKALELDPSLGRAYQLLASVSESQRKWQEAEEFYELAVRGSDAEARVLLSYARFSSLLNRPDQAYLLIDRAIAIEPTSSAAWGRAALFRVRHRDYETALNFLERLRASGDEVNFYWLRAVTLYFLGRHRQALTDIEIADDLLRDFPGVTGGVYAYVRCQLGLDDHLVELASDYGRASPLFLDTAIAISVCQQEIDQAFAHINDLMETGENIWLLEQPFDVLREDPRWQYVHGYMNLANH